MPFSSSYETHSSLKRNVIAGGFLTIVFHLLLLFLVMSYRSGNTTLSHHAPLYFLALTPTKPPLPRFEEAKETISPSKNSKPKNFKPHLSKPEEFLATAPAVLQVLEEKSNSIQEKRIDLDALKKMAGQAALESYLQRSERPVAQLQKKPLYAAETETRLGRKIQEGARPDCRHDNGAGLLAPLTWLMDAKDSGCKW